MQRRHLLSGFWAAVAGSLAPRAASAQSAEELTREIIELLRKTETIWNSQETHRLRNLWDRTDPQPYYLAAEQEDWFIGWDQINAYLAPEDQAPVTEAIRVRFYDIQVRPLAADLAFAAYWMRTDMKLVYADKPFGSDNRVSSVFRRKPEGWRYVTYAEGFQSPVLYMQKLIEKNVAPDYQEFYQQVTGNGDG